MSFVELSSKDETAVTKVTERAKPTLVTIGNKQVISSGRWNNDAVANFVLLHGRDKWLPIGDLARLAYGASYPRSKERVRKSLSGLFRTLLLSRGELLVIEYGPPLNRAKAVKLFDAKSTIDLQNMNVRLERMRKRRELTVAQYERAMGLLLQQGIQSNAATQTTLV